MIFEASKFRLLKKSQTAIPSQDTSDILIRHSERSESQGDYNNMESNLLDPSVPKAHQDDKINVTS